MRLSNSQEITLLVARTSPGDVKRISELIVQTQALHKKSVLCVLFVSLNHNSKQKGKCKGSLTVK